MHHTMVVNPYEKVDFMIAIRKGRTHVLAEHMSRIPNGEAPIGVDDELLVAPLFMIDLVSKWTKKICHYLKNGLPTNKPLNMERARRLIRDLLPIILLRENCTKIERMEGVKERERENQFPFFTFCSMDAGTQDDHHANLGVFEKLSVKAAADTSSE